MTRTRLISLAKYLLLGLFLVLILFTSSVYWLTRTSSGTAWLWKQVEEAATGAVRVAEISGDLSSGITIQALEYRTDKLTLSVQAAEVQAGLGWWPLSIQVRSLLLQDISVLIQTQEKQVIEANDEMDIRSVVTSLKLPVRVNVHAAEIKNITLQSGDEAPLTLIESLSFQAVLDDKLKVDNLAVITAELEAKFNGQLQLQSPFGLSAELVGVYNQGEAAAASAFVFPFELSSSGNLNQIQLRFVSAGYGMVIEGEIDDPLADPVWDITGAVDHIRWPLELLDDVFTVSGVSLASQGRIGDWSFALDSNLESETLQASVLNISGSGSATNIHIKNAQLNGPDVSLGVSGKLDWSSTTTAGLSADIKQLDFSPWLGDWPAGKYLAGNLELNWSDTSLDIPSARLTVTGTELVANMKADIDTEANRVEAILDWSGLSWPLADSTPEFASQSGMLKISGSMDDWTGSGQAKIQFDDYPQGWLEIQGKGDRTSGGLSILHGEVLGGSVSGEAIADWVDGLTLDASLRTLGINPERVFPGWPGRIDADLALSVRSQPDLIEIELASFQGMLRGISVDGSGGLVIQDNNITFKQFEVQTDEAVLQLNGNHADPAGVTANFSGYLPTVLLDGASGAVEMEGRFSTNSKHPLVDVQLEALDLAWQGFRVKALSIETKQPVNEGPLPAFQLDAAAFNWQDILIDDISLSFNPVGEKHIVEASLSGEDVSLLSTITLMPEHPAEFLNSSWRGELENLELLVNQIYSFELSEPAAFEWTSGSMSLESLCLKDNKGAAMCASGAYQTNGNSSVLVDITAFPVNYFRDILALDARFEQQIEGRLEFHKLNGQAPTGDADFKISAGRVLDLEDNDVLSETSEGRFAFTLQNGNLDSGVLDMGLPGSGFIDVDFEVLNIMLDGQREIKGRAITHLEDIKLLGHLALPGVDDVGGSFDSNILLGGTVRDPAFSGGFKLSNGLIRYAPIGLKLEDLEFEGQLEKRDRGVLNGEFRAGEGIGSINGRFLFDDIEHLRMELTLAGTQLLLVDTDTLKILTEADLKLELSPQRIDINGRIAIPQASLTPANLILDSVNDSEDLVVENDGLNQEPAGLKGQSKTQVHGQLEVAFGDDVLIEVPGVKTNIMGSVVYNWSGDPVPVAKGNYSLTGTVDVYGPSLQIRKGRISFPDVAANNPILNIRAERKVFGNTQIRSAGVRVIGTLKKPVLEAYTVPVTTEDRAWSLLVTGSDFDQSQGVGGFDVGTYIAPKLYVSYGISLFEDENVVSARYDLKKGFGVKVTSGQRETGLDVSYTVDK